LAADKNIAKPIRPAGRMGFYIQLLPARLLALLYSEAPVFVESSCYCRRQLFALPAGSFLL